LPDLVAAVAAEPTPEAQALSKMAAPVLLAGHMEGVLEMQAMGWTIKPLQAEGATELL
jgi:hypothetical protein